MIAANSSVPYMPRFVTLVVPPSSSLLTQLPDCAPAAAKSLVAAAICVMDMDSTPRRTGVTSPVSVAIATAMSTESNMRIESSVQITLAAGTRACALRPRP